jgi:hypothetical protein
MNQNELGHLLRMGVQSALLSDDFQKQLAKQIARNTAKGVFFGTLLIFFLATATAIILSLYIKR